MVVPTIYRHDDGWRDWELAPTIDPANGRPRSFLEMPGEVAYEIWRQSIASVADLGPLAQYMVAEHFCRLRRAADDHSGPLDQKFLVEYGTLGARWLDEWRLAAPTRNTPAVADAAVRWLQFFDRFSLWLCMAERVKPEMLALPGGDELSLMPAAREPQAAVIGARPWLWTAAERRLSTTGRLLNAQRFSGDAEFQAALADVPAVQVNWRLMAC